MTIHKVTGAQPANSTIVNLRCPHCNHQGAFHGFDNCKDISWVETINVGNQRQGVSFAAGMRKCPNPACSGLVQVILETGCAIPTIATTHSDGSRPAVPIDRDQCSAGADGAVG